MTYAEVKVYLVDAYHKALTLPGIEYSGYAALGLLSFALFVLWRRSVMKRKLLLVELSLRNSCAGVGASSTKISDESLTGFCAETLELYSEKLERIQSSTLAVVERCFTNVLIKLGDSHSKSLATVESIIESFNPSNE
jgi:hypothetical protein